MKKIYVIYLYSEYWSEEEEKLVEEIDDIIAVFDSKKAAEEYIKKTNVECLKIKEMVLNKA